MITINEIKEKPAKVFHNDTFLGTIDTQYQLNDIRLQVSKNKIEGIYFLFLREDGVEERIDCNKNGQLDAWRS